MIGVTVRAKLALTETERQILLLPNRLRSLDQFLLVAIGPLVLDTVTRHWTSKGAAFGHAWAPWSQATLAERLRKGNTQLGILHDTGALERAVFRAAESPRVEPTPSGVSLVVELTPADDPKALFHQLGTSRMPARQIFPDPAPNALRDPARRLLREFVLTGKISGRAAGSRLVS